MTKKGPFAARLEDDDPLREETMKKALRELPDVQIHFSGSIAGFWECLWLFQPEILVIDVMLPEVPDVKRLSEGVALAKWVRLGQIPDSQAAQVPIAPRLRKLPRSYASTYILFITGRAAEKLQSELQMAEVQNYDIVEKGADTDVSAVDLALGTIRQAAEALVQS
jgi:DNA-binding NarL/FixJ family response regulator